ncbi:transglutaminase-like domain-containing protein [Actinomadura algeriensis]|uniref:Transglutaminase-like putative cysteine protease n=1 Tax=Actinomadura algeriensis TaxID=1679523 RepID=A0ABR9JNF3_9ACTN|nr:transglutaminase-like domain-containing protein [Actinomadura algeriensis]MBE1532099.1 transglutaminase-like putative cysteine protease [Actinomadura algeriensis]
MTGAFAVRAVRDLPPLMLATAAAGPLLAAGYDEAAPVVAVLGATAVLSVVVTAAAHRLPRRIGPAAALPAGLPVAAGWLVVLAVLRPGRIDAPVPAAADAVLHSGARILTTAAGAPATVDLLAFPVLAVWLAGAAGTLLRRDGHALPALLPATLLLIGAAVLNPDAVGAARTSAVLLAAAGAVLLATAPAEPRAPAGVAVRVLAAGAPRRGPRRRGPDAAAAALACAVALPGLGAAVAAPGALAGWPVRAADPRTVVDAPEEPRDVRNPLAYLGVWAADPSRPLLTVDGPSTGLRWVALGEFTGATWLPDSSYRPAGTRFPPPDVRPPRSTAAAVRVTVGALPGYWVPVPGTPTRLDGLAAGYDAASGTVMADDPVAGRSYRAAGAVADWSGGEASRAGIDTGDARHLRLPPGAPARLTDIARAAAGDGTPHRRASRLAEYLRESYTFDPGAPSGHGYADLNRLLVDPGRTGGGATSEQFAAAFAVLARAIGLPSRVVVGFGPGSGGVVRTGDAVAWGEIHYEGIGWVPYDPNPRERSDAPDRRDDDATIADDDGGADSPGGGASGGTARPVAESGPSALRHAVPGAALVLLYLLAVPLLRLRRPRGGGTARTLAAWARLLAAMRLARAPAPPAATVGEVTARLARALPAHDPARIRRLAATVNAAGYGGAVTPADASAAVAEARALAGALRRTRPWPHRLLWWWDPRPLRWARDRRRVNRPSRPGTCRRVRRGRPGRRPRPRPRSGSSPRPGSVP